MEWDEFYVGLDSELETANFGTRQLVQLDHALYETVTLATIGSGKEVESSPRISARTCDVNLILAINQQIIVFEEGCRDIILRMAFESIIDCFTFTRDGQFLIVGLETGIVHFIQVQTQCHLFSRKVTVVSGSCMFRKIYCREGSTNKIYDFIFVSSDGSIISMCNVQLEEILEAKEKELSEQCEQIEAQIKIQESRYNGPDMKISTALLVDDYGEEPYLLMAGDGIILWRATSETDYYEMVFPPMEGLQKIARMEPSNNKRLLLVLHEDGKLSVLCAVTLTFLYVLESICVLDFIMLDIGTGTEDSLLALVKYDEADQMYLEQLSFPGFQSKFKVKVSRVSFLATLASKMEDIVFLEGSLKENSKYPQSLNIKALSESLPELRLDRLLRRRKYSEAKQFAATFGLDVQKVYIEEAKYYAESMSPWTCMASEDKKYQISDLINILDKINDNSFVAECCINVVLPSFELARSILCYARERLMKISDEDMNTADLSRYMSKVSESLHRLDTFEFIYNNGSLDEWINFSSVDMLKECERYASQAYLKEAAMIWSRHLSEFKSVLSTDRVISMLESIPQRTKSHELLPILKAFIPDVMRIIPDALSKFILWVQKYTKSLEGFERSNWPQVGVDFSKAVLSVVDFSSRSLSNSTTSAAHFFLHQQYMQANSPLHQLTEMIQGLQEMCRLKKDFKITVPVSHYLQDDRTKVVAALLDRVIFPDEINLLFDGFVKGYMTRYGLDCDKVVSKYIEDIIRGCPVGWWYWDEAPWEQRVAVLLKYVHNVQDRFKCVLLALKMAPVPWSSTITAITEEALKLNHPLTDNIRDQQNLVCAKAVLKKYALKQCTKHLELSYNFRLLVLYIFKEGKEDALEDALQLAMGKGEAEKLEVYILYIHHLLETGSESEAMSVLNKLDNEDCIKCCQRIILKMYSLIERNMLGPFEDSYMGVFNQVISKLEKVLDETLPSSKKFIMEELPIDEIRNTLKLKVDFNKTVPLKEYSDCGARQKLLQECIGSFIQEDAKLGEDEVFQLYTKSERLATILQFPPEEGTVELATKLIEKGRIMDSSKVTEKFDCLRENQFAASKLYNLSYNLITSPINSDSNSTRISSLVGHQLAKQATVCCSSEMLMDCLELCKWSSFSHSFDEIVTADPFRSPSNTIQRDPLNKWRFTPLYQELTSYPDKGSISNDIRNVIAICVPKPCKNHLPFTFCWIRNQLKLDSSLPESDRIKEVDSLILENFSSVLLVARNLGDYGFELLSYRCLYMCELTTIICLWHQVKEVPVFMASENFLSGIVRSVLMKICSSNHFDFDLAFGLLCGTWQKKALEGLQAAIKRFGQDSKKVLELTTLGIHYSKVMKLKKNFTSFLDLHKHFEWNRKFKVRRMPLKCSSLNSLKEYHMLLELFVTYPTVEISDVEMFCNDFNLDLTEGLLMYLRTILLDWKPIVETKKGTNGKEVNISGDDVIKEKIRNIIAIIKDKRKVYEYLQNLWNEVNHYHCEIYLCLLEHLHVLSIALGHAKVKLEENKMALLFLKKYQRVSPPIEDETIAWFQKFPDLTSLPEIAQWRLPYIITKEKDSSIIRREINVSTYKTWLDAAHIFNMDPNRVFIYAVQQSLTHAPSVCAREEGYPENILEEIDECVSHSKDLETATAIMSWVVRHLPPGPEKVAAAKKASYYSLKWKEEGDPKGSEAFPKMSAKYRHLATEEILKCYKLNTTQYLGLINIPVQLIEALYHDKSIVERGQKLKSDCPDINAAVNEISEVNELKVGKHRLELVEKWLVGGNMISDADDTTECSIMAWNPNTNVNFESDETLLRMSYVMMSFDAETIINYLIPLAFGDELYETNRKLRALQCMCSLASDEMLQKCTGRDISSIKAYMKSLFYVHELENIRVMYSAREFDACNKLSLVRMIWRNHSHNRRAVMIVARLCLDYQLHQSHLWNSILINMVQLKMTEELEYLLPQLTAHTHLWCNLAYIEAWKVTLMTPFQKAHCPMSADQEEACVRSLILLQACPVFRDVDFPSLGTCCLQLKRLDMAACLLPFLASDKQANLKIVILKATDVDTISNELQVLLENGVLSASQALGLLRTDTTVSRLEVKVESK